MKENNFIDTNVGVVTIPNLLTLLRIFSAPFVLVFSYLQNYALALLVFCISAATDWLDGKIARTFNLQSNLGRKLDPVADKMLTLCAYLAMYHDIRFLFWIIVGRDVFILSGLILTKIVRIELKINPLFISKINTSLQALLPLFWLTFKILSPNSWPITSFFANHFSSIWFVLQFIVLTTTCLSFAAYVKVFILAISKNNQ
jgi:cardiolipin synthase